MPRQDRAIGIGGQDFARTGSEERAFPHDHFSGLGEVSDLLRHRLNGISRDTLGN
jgi:hypothetical protein